MTHRSSRLVFNFRINAALTVHTAAEEDLIDQLLNWSCPLKIENQRTTSA